eukprot:TRINITY_DN38876_c0_g1_i1.p1 TRINITY_DN38876_c0_g1~~TRINITY_DN38876_c0_g1_i1.p1  ORF type:complete len:311 (+),score=82.16 TRINITY_DN38876_c0_g1_i1:32-964(+)
MLFFFFQAEDGIRDLVRSRGLGDVYKRQEYGAVVLCMLRGLLSVLATQLTLHCAAQMDPLQALGLGAAAQQYLQTPPPDQPPAGADLLQHVTVPSEDVFTPECFERQDSSSDAFFYAEPRMVTHIDDTAIAALSEHYAKVLPTGGRHLDLCASWVSFLPQELRPSRCVGLGMNLEELAANPQLSEHLVHDLNKDPTLPFSADSFDAVTNVVSIDYMVHPVQLLQQAHRVLSSGGLLVCSFSNRMFWTKAVRIWTAANEWQRVLVCAAYLASAGFREIQAFELVGLGQGSDPMYVVPVSYTHLTLPTKRIV